MFSKIQAFFCRISLKLVIIRANVGISPVYPAETLWYSAELPETKPFIEMTGADILRNDRIELQNSEAELFSDPERIANKRFADMLSPAGFVNGIACVADMSAASYVVRVKYVHSADCAVNVLGNSAIGLRGEEFPSAFVREVFLLRKSSALVNDNIPYSYHFGNIPFGIFSYLHIFPLLLL